MQWQVGKRYGHQDVGNPDASGVHPQFALTPTCACCGATPDTAKDAFFPACYQDVCGNPARGAWCVACGKCPAHCLCVARRLAPLAPTMTAVLALMLAGQAQRVARIQRAITAPTDQRRRRTTGKRGAR